jgi:hypothetical protein
MNGTGLFGRRQKVALYFDSAFRHFDSFMQLKLFAGGRADRYRQGVVFDQRKVATDVTNWRLMHRMLAENIPMALIMEDDFILPEGGKPKAFETAPASQLLTRLFRGSDLGRTVLQNTLHGACRGGRPHTACQ